MRKSLLNMSKIWGKRFPIACLLGVLILVQTSWPAEPGKPHPVTIEDLLGLRNGFSAEISPDGREVVFSVMEPGNPRAAKPPIANLWMASVDSGARPTRLTAGPQTDWSPHWASDGKRIAFLSSRSGSTHVYVISLPGRRTTPVTPADVDVLQFSWSHDGRRLAILTDDDRGEHDYGRHLAGSVDEVVISRRSNSLRLSIVDLATGNLRPITPPGITIMGFDWSPDDAQLIILSRKSDGLEYFPVSPADIGSLAIIPASGGEIKTFANLKGTGGAVRWSPDGSRIALQAHDSKGIGKLMRTIMVFDLRSGQPPRNLLSNYQGSVLDFDWTPDGKQIVFTGAEGVYTGIRVVDLESGAVASTPLPDGAMEELTVSSARPRMAFFDAGPHHPRDLWVADLEGHRRQLTELNPQTKNLIFGDQEVVRWKTTDGASIEGLLLKPNDFQPGKRYPLVVMAHGGITGWSRWKHGFLTDVGQVMAAGYGYAVLYPNPRGTPGYGTQFEDALVGDIGGREIVDILKGVDSLIEQNIADPERLGIGGWSWGGTTAAWTVSPTDRFRCAVDGGGIVDWVSFFGQSDSPFVATLLLGGSPSEHPDLYRERSTIFHLDQIHTPLLVIHGEQDDHIPAGQAWEIYRGLKMRDKEVEFVIYPREKEFLTEPAHALNFMNRVLDWYQRYLKPGSPEQPSDSGTVRMLSERAPGDV